MIRHLTKRETILFAALAAFALVWTLYAVAVKPAMARVETLSRVIPQKQDELREFHAKSAEYVSLRGRLAELQSKLALRQPGFEVLAFLESTIQECGLAGKTVAMKQRVVSLDPKYYETIVEIRLEGVTLRQLVDFICKAESSEVLTKTKSLHIRKSLTNKDLLDSVAEIHTAKSTVRLTANQ